MLKENRFSKYLLYAIGEIFLVVIGILIALQINNSNENRKQNHSMLLAIESLKEDFKQDTTQLKADIRQINYDLHQIENFIVRLLKPAATFDTLIHIARYEYLPFFNPGNELNRNTIVSLLSTGNLDFFDEDIKSKILSHSAEQLREIKIMDENVGIFLGSQGANGIFLQSEHPFLY